MSRSDIEKKYKEYMGLPEDRAVPGIAKFSDGELEEMIGLLGDSAQRVEKARAEGRLSQLKERQAQVLSSDDSIKSWLRSAFTRWEVEGAKAFAPFNRAVELYNRPSSGVAATYERLSGLERERFLDAVSQFVAESISTRDPSIHVKIELGHLTKLMRCGSDVILHLGDNAYLVLEWMRVDAWPFQSGHASGIWRTYLRRGAWDSAVQAVSGIFRHFGAFTRYFRDGLLTEKHIDGLRAELQLMYDDFELQKAFDARQISQPWLLRLALPLLSIKVPSEVLINDGHGGHAVGSALSLQFELLRSSSLVGGGQGTAY